MIKHRFIGNFAFSRDTIQITNSDHVHKIRKVLRLNAGERLVLSDGEGMEAEMEIDEIREDKVLARVIKKYRRKPVYEQEVHLYCALIKRQNFELVAQKATEVGVSQITPLISERTEKFGLKADRLHKKIREAAEQSGRAYMPQLTEQYNFTEAVTKAAESNKQNILFDPSGSKLEPSLAEKPLSIFIGPEGGWTDEEIKDAKEAGFAVQTLPGAILRTETAAIIATFLTAH